MKKMINLALRTEYSFQKTYGFIDEIIGSQGDVVGVADINNTFSHFYLYEKCKELGKKPIFGVRLMVVRDPEERIPPRGQFGPEYIFIAKNYEGLIEIYKLVERAHECFYYRAHIGLVDVWKLSDNVIVIAPHFVLDERIDYIAVCNITSPVALKSDLPKVAINNNWMVNADDKEVYELFAGKRKVQKYSFTQHILSHDEWMVEFNNQEAIDNTHVIADMCNVEFPRAEPVIYKGTDKIRTLCRKGAKAKGINLKDPVYKARLKRELDLIKEKDFTDYFMIVQEMVNKAKEEMLVGPSRGSSAGSLVCYLLGITEIDPIKWGLLFERFIDINRFDMPDIDVDFPDVKRGRVVKELIKTNGRDNVKNIATIAKMNPKGAIGDFAKELGIPPEDVETLKNSIISRSGGDARKNYCMMDTLATTDVGKKFMEVYPQMEPVGRIEKHSRHSGTHAAGMIVATKPLHNFASVDPRDNTIQMDGKSAEKINLLKIDCLGLSTLTVLEEVAELIGMDYKDYYNLPIDDDKVYKIFRDVMVKGVFQFEGHALAGLCRTIKATNIEDIIAITALARPGPLHGGGAAKFSKIHSGQEEIEYVMKDKDVQRITEKTMGVIVYQEQVMQILREVGGFPWASVATVRKLISKKSGIELLNKFKLEFIEGSVKKGLDKEDVEAAWEKILKFAQYGFNRSHAVAYGLVSYWTAWAKVYHPLEFLVANLNHPKGTFSTMRLIREMLEMHKFKFIPFDSVLSEDKWRIVNGKVIGPLTNIDGIGNANAKAIMKKREIGAPNTPSIEKKLENPVTKFDIIYPCRHYWGELFRSPKRFGLHKKPTVIKKVDKKGEYLIVAQLIKKNVRDLNEAQNVIKRGGEVYDDNTKLLNITVEDDTGSIMCRINRFDFDKLGKEVAEDGEEETDWYLIKGKIISDEVIFLFISDIHKLGDGYSEGQTIRDL